MSRASLKRRVVRHRAARHNATFMEEPIPLDDLVDAPIEPAPLVEDIRFDESEITDV
jgi:hypothetical protein